MTPRPLDPATPDQPAPDSPDSPPDLTADASDTPDDGSGEGAPAGLSADADADASDAARAARERSWRPEHSRPVGRPGHGTDPVRRHTAPGRLSRGAAAGDAAAAGRVRPRDDHGAGTRSGGPVSGWGYSSWLHRTALDPGEAPAARARTAPPAHDVHRARIEGLLLGLAAGDAAGWPAARHRAARMPEWTRRLTRELDTFAEQNATTTLPVPIALNQPPEPLRLGPSDDAEWAAFAAETVLASAGERFDGLDPGRRMRAAVDLAWNALAGKIAAAEARAPEVEAAVPPLRARISVRAGLGNLATGLRPPATGHDNPHYFDDAACVRAAVLAVIHPGDPRSAADLAEFDARYTQDGDGVHGARAMAAAVAAALGGAPVDASVGAALAELPEA
ncbi:ADP-ribosylglycohydrolase family protein, partial [Streptomyces wuyuanensis]|uniref:ADP-ribosylglycohydrolase family protein n=1 Tax=Streptomyces wuyuanensis TaxID=1196353 RepID=UPI003819888E